MSNTNDCGWKDACDNTILRGKEKANEHYNTLYTAYRQEAERIEHTWAEIQFSDEEPLRISVSKLAFVVVKVLNALRTRGGAGEGLNQLHSTPWAKTIKNIYEKLEQLVEHGETGSSASTTGIRMNEKLFVVDRISDKIRQKMLEIIMSVRKGKGKKAESDSSK